MFRNTQILNIFTIFSIYKTKNNSGKDLLSDIIEKLSHRLDVSNTDKVIMRFFLSQTLKNSIGGQDMKILTEYLSILPSHINIIWDFNFDWEEEDQFKLIVFNLKEI